ncbi:MAG TPA: hypothetical protein VMT88_02435 [Actinomycetes bacterium]|nr:hypothetical protein [Actinomycetes bacterium]
MTAATATPMPVSTSSRRLSIPVVTLGRREAKRILVSPIYLAIALFLLATSGLRTAVELKFDLPTAAATYEFVIYLTALYAGLLTYMAAHLVSTSSRRSHADRQLAAAPMGTRLRSGGLCLGVVLGPGAVALGLMVLLAWLGTFVSATDGASSVLADASSTQPFSVAELAQVFLTVIGGGLFAVLVATWLRFPGSLPIGLVVLVFGTAFLLDPDRSPVNTLPWLAPYISASDWTDEPWALSGSQTWHVWYLLGLCGLAVCGVMLREREGRLRWLFISAAVLLLTGLVGWAQL